MGRFLEGVVDRAQKLKAEWRDEFVSVEHLVLGIAGDPQFGQKAFRTFNLSYESLLKAVQDIRGSNTVVDQARSVVLNQE